MSGWVELLSTALIVIGLFFTLVATFGALRLPDVYTRLQAATKGATLGVGAILVGSALHFASVTGAVGVKELLAILFLFFTAPVAAHMTARAAYLTGVPFSERSTVLELPPARPAATGDRTEGPS